MKSSLIIDSTTQDGKKIAKTITNLNPNATQEQVQQFAQRLTGLTTNTYDGARRVQVVDVTEPYVAGGGSYVTVPVEVTVPGENVTVTVEAEPVTVTVAGEATTVTVAGDPKPSPSFTLGGWSAVDTVYSAVISYTGDGALSTSTGTISGSTITVEDIDGIFSGEISASEGTNYAAGKLAFDCYMRRFTPTLSLGDWDNTLAEITYTGDGTLTTSSGTISGGSLIADSGASGTLSASATEYYYSVHLPFEAPIIVDPYAEYLIASLPFTTSTTQDLCGGTWTETGSPTIQDGALDLPNNSKSYVSKSGGLTFGGQDFTISCWHYARPGYSYVFYFGQTSEEGQAFTRLFMKADNGNYALCSLNENTSSGGNVNNNAWSHIACVYRHSEQKIFVFADGVKIIEQNSTIARTNFEMILIACNIRDNEYGNAMIKDWKFCDGIALYTENFTPPVMPS